MHTQLHQAMLNLQILDEGRQESWDRFISNSENGTLFHRLNFLAYHGDRFEGSERHLVWLKGSEIVAAMPMAMTVVEGRRIARSPYGASWGGPAHANGLSLQQALELVQLLLQFLEHEKADRCEITLPPSYCWRAYTNHVEFALAHHGFTPEIQEITQVIPVPAEGDVMNVHRSAARTQIRKAQKTGVEIQRNAPIERIYPLLECNRHRVGGRMTHSLDELKRLQARELGSVKCDAAMYDGEVIAANVYLQTGRALLSFYPSHDPEYAWTSALSLLLHDAVRWSQEQGLPFLDLGCSSYRMNVPNPGVARFKENLGARGYFRTTYVRV